MKKSLLLSVMFIALIFTSCKKEKEQTVDKNSGTVQLSMSVAQVNKLKSALTTVNDAAAVLITIESASGDIVYDTKKVLMYNMNGSFISEPISLKKGDYKLSKFMVLDAADVVIYATPLEGSPLAYLVLDPLPIAFTVTKDQVTKVVPEVLSVEGRVAAEFGYNSLSLAVVPTFDFLCTAMVYDQTAQDWQLTTASITIVNNAGVLAYNNSLAAITNQITLRDDAASFTITVTKDGYDTYTATMTANELKQYFSEDENGPLIVKLTEKLTVTDIDGNVYNTVKIGEQVWMKENLKVTHYNNGDPIATSIPATLDISGETEPKYQWAYNGDETNVATYGRLYTWYAATDSRDVCPNGWHLPTDAEWTQLTDYLGGANVAGGKLKEIGTFHWLSPNTGATNESQFTAFPVGLKVENGSFENNNYICLFWSGNSLINQNRAWSLMIDANHIYAVLANTSMLTGVSVRCVKD